MIYVTGDTHGEQNRFIYSKEEKQWTASDVVIVCGDFGFLFRDNDTERYFLDDLERRPYTLCFVDGNHENFPAIYAYPEELWNGGKVHRIRKNIFHLMRGQVFEIQGKTFFTFGGGYSRDRGMRQLNVSYWEEELPCEAEYQEAKRNLARYGNEVDYVLTHTAPLPIAWQAACRKGHYLEEGDGELMRFLNTLRCDLHFRHWYFGHFHDDISFGEDFTLVYQAVIPLK